MESLAVVATVAAATAVVAVAAEAEAAVVDMFAVSAVAGRGVVVDLAAPVAMVEVRGQP